MLTIESRVFIILLKSQSVPSMYICKLLSAQKKEIKYEFLVPTLNQN